MKKILLSTIGCLIALTGLLRAQSFKEVQQLLPTPELTSEGHEFGTAVAISGNIAVVGAPGENAAYVLKFDGSQWVQRSKLSIPNSDANDKFGYSVAMWEDIIAVGAIYDGSDGALYLFQDPQLEWQNPAHIAQLTPDFEGSFFTNTSFGYAIDITDEVIVVGSDDKAAFVFEKSEEGWKNATQTAVLTQSSPDFHKSFGRNVSISENTVVLSDYRTNSDQGVAYVYEKPSSGWQDATETATLVVADEPEGRYFGSSVDIQDDVIAVGATRYGQSGVVYIYEKPPGGWSNASYSARLEATDEPFEALGASVQVQGNKIIVGSENGGAVFLYQRKNANWTDMATATAKLEAANGKRHKKFGIPLATDGNTLIAGGTQFGPGGSVYFYRATANMWQSATETQKLEAPLVISATEHSFGSHVAIDGDYAVVSSPGNQAGIVEVFSYQNEVWGRAAKLSPSVVLGSRLRLGSVDISGNTVVVGYQGSSTEATVLVYKKPDTGWKDMTESATLTIDDPETYSTAASSVDVDGNTILINAHGYGSAGAVYVYERPAAGWVDMTQTAKLINSDGGTGGQFGISAGISNQTVVVGDNFHGSQNQGAVYVFEKPTAGWQNMTETAQLTVSNSSFGAKLGESVTIEGSIIVASALGRTFSKKAVYLFEKPANGWTNATETAILSSRTNGDYDMGEHLSISGNTLALESAGKALIYQKPAGGWTDTQETFSIKPTDGYVDAVALSGNTLLAGTPSDNSLGKSAGASLVYSLQLNTLPELVQQIASQVATEGSSFSLLVSPAAFVDADDDKITYSATLENGLPLPAWLVFDATEVTFSGIPTTADIGESTVRLAARDNHGETSTTFTITVQEANEEESDAEEPDAEESSPEEEPTPNEEEEDITEEEVEKPADAEQPVAEEEQVDTVTDLDNGVKQHDVLLYPNPSSGAVKVSSSRGIQQLIIGNAQGQIVFHRQYAGNNNIVSINALRPGLYWMIVQTSQSLFTKQLIVE